MVLPTSAEDTSEAIQLIVANDCPFGIRSGGHSVFPLSSSVLDGITIDFGKYKTIITQIRPIYSP
jgi:hypothetical protein